MNTFPKGIHPDGHKFLTEDEKIIIMPAPDTVYIPVGSGEMPKLHIKEGDSVSGGQLLATLDRTGCNFFASCSGKVKAFEKRPVVGGEAVHIVIENDHMNKYVTLPKMTNPSKEEIIQRISYSGIVGMGGAGYPSGKKLQQNKKIDTFIVNAAECEPYITCDNRIMIEHTRQVIEGALLLKTASDAERVVIAVEDNKPKAIAALMEELNKRNDPSVQLAVLKTKYPQGDARRLIFAVTGRRVPSNKRSTDFGVLMNNVHTAYAVCLAVQEGIPCYNRVMTVTGGGIGKPGNLLVPNGTLYTDILAFCGGADEERTVKMVSGGPMTGVALLHTDYAATKTAGCLLLMTRQETNADPASNCINCGKCFKVCPVNIMPMYIDLYTRAGDMEGAKKYGAEFCIECGCCAYICPAKRHLVMSIAQAKNALKKRGNK